MNVITYEEYFRKFVIAGIAGSMYHIDLLDLDTAAGDLRSGRYAPDHLILESFTVNTDLQHADQIFDQFLGAVLILAPSNIRTLNQQAKTQLLNSTFESIALIKRSMIQDKYSGCHLMEGLVVQSMITEKVGPVLDGFFGWRLQFQVNIDQNMEL